MIKRDLTFQAKKMAPDHFPQPVEMFDESTPGWLGVPRAWGRKRYARTPMVDRMSDGEPLIGVTKRPDPHHPRAAPGQAKFMVDMKAAFQRQDEVQAIAPTGTGKTVVALETAAWLGRKFLVMVHLERIADQWIEEIHDKLGIPRELIGRVQGPTCQWQGMACCVAILNSAAQRTYTKEFYQSFGFVITDEAHKVGTEFFSPAIPRFPARKRLTLTATDIRRDGGHIVIVMHAGPIAIESEAVALPGDVYVLDYDCRSYRLWGSDSRARNSCLAKDPSRNRMLATQIKRAYDRGRNFLAISHAVEHVEVVMKMVEAMGVPKEHMGQFTGEYTVRNPDGKPMVYKGKPVRRKYGKAHFEKIKQDESIRLIFATYAVFTEAIDIVRLDAGMDMTPRASATQVIGRIRRPQPGKKRPLWVTPRDVRCTISLRAFESRCRDYLSTGMEMVNWDARS
jgi:superfamily II DNA or RNA helicase